MIKGLAITPPVIGRISIGKLIKKNDKLIPEKDDSFTLTTQVQNRDGWMLHPLHQQYADSSHNGKIRMIPVRVLFNDSNLNLRAEFSAFDRTTGRPLCVGDGEKAKRVSGEGIDEVACLTPERCAFAQEKGCKLFGRLNVQIEGQNDELGSITRYARWQHGSSILKRSVVATPAICPYCSGYAQKAPRNRIGHRCSMWALL